MSIAIAIIFTLLFTNIFTMYYLYKMYIRAIKQESQLRQAIYRRNLYKALFKETLPKEKEK